MSSVPARAHAAHVQDLTLAYQIEGVDRLVLRQVDLNIARGESFGLVGESGCGKTSLALVLTHYLPENARVTGGQAQVAGEDVVTPQGRALRSIRRNSVAMVYQNPADALNPTMRVGKQVEEAFRVLGVSRQRATQEALRMLRDVQITDAQYVMRRYPHELSGGMQQRIVIAMALAKSPELLILDEPTTGLDVTVEAEVLALVASLREKYGTAILLISHDLRIVARVCERVGVLYAGRLVEEGPTEEVFTRPRHPYTSALLNCVPRRSTRTERKDLTTIPGELPTLGMAESGCLFEPRCSISDARCSEEVPAQASVGDGHSSRCFFPERAGAQVYREVEDGGAGGTSSVLGRAEEEQLVDPRLKGSPLLKAVALSKTVGGSRRLLKIVDEVNLELDSGRTLGIVGESGSGKTTLARLLLGLAEPDAGSRILLDDRTLAPKIDDRDIVDIRAIQTVFQNPASAVNPRHSIRYALKRSLVKLSAAHLSPRQDRIEATTDAVKLDRGVLDRRPSALSGGMKQRVAIARAFVAHPRIVVFDEPTSALDVSVQATILNLLIELQKTTGTAYVFISHDLDVIRYISDSVLVMYLGQMMEHAGGDELFRPPFHPYTESLITTRFGNSASRTGKRIVEEETLPTLTKPSSGCVFHPRCPRKIGAICESEEPALQELASGRQIKCHIPAEELLLSQKADLPVVEGVEEDLRTQAFQ